ncbi:MULTISPECIES: DUF4402 domain-containing protein [Salegentibacter]|jgi:hypothetical protein|uniref:DUF4402 domain-containing protein n=1 Tax=Salegentibacter agarivorans TaxID=345907 RepID=A0A1I2NDB6_9FLAO|nr:MULTISPECIES: DUF4402 domain-containing protein [Salegentibacter]APS39710.1 hypothetical protein AO058_12840 [Salegentibacter sp. T436]SFF99496.1 protein of unknown function [Salegentibacter agarivorans]
MTRFYLITLILLFTGMSPVFAQASATANFTASATIIQPIGITTTSNMQFANIDAQNGGAVILTPENTRITTGELVLADGGNFSAATFEVTGQSGFAFGISLPRGTHRLSSGSESMILQDFTTNYDGSSINGDGKTIRVGASLIVNPNQKPGDYKTNNDLQVTVNYN